MNKIISVVNQKGGVAKTTSVLNIVHQLAIKKYKVLAIDLDPQGNLTTGLGFDKNQFEITSYEVLCKNSDINQAIILSDLGFSLIPANRNLSGAEIELINQDDRAFILTQQIQKISQNFDYIVIDCPPSLSMLTINALSASNCFIIPTQCEYFALEGLTDLLATVDKIKKAFNPNLDLLGIIKVMYDKRSRLTNEISNELEKYFGAKVFNSSIPRSVRVAEANSFGKSVIAIDVKNPASLAYVNLTAEILERLI